jgi:hypothetical protein
MKKIKSLFKRDYEGTRLVYDEVVPGSEWVLAGEGFATLKIDGTCCLVRDGHLYKRYDRKLTKSAWRRKKKGHPGPWGVSDFKPAPPSWEAAEAKPNQHTGHWPGWVLVGDGPEDKWHREAWEWERERRDGCVPPDGTYELVGPKVQGNPYEAERHQLWRHGKPFVGEQPPRDFEGLKQWFETRIIEGIVWWRDDGCMVKIKRRDFGLPWPAAEAAP